MSYLAELNLAVAAIGAACLVAAGLLMTRGERRNKARIQPAEPTNCDRAHAQQQHRKETEL